MKFKKGIFMALVFILASCASDVSASMNLPSTSTNLSSSETSSVSSTKPPRPHTHSLTEWTVIEEADLFHTGKKERHCQDDNYQEIITYYDLSEVEFKDQTYQYSGQEKVLTISGLLPKGVTVEYENNRRTQIGTNLAIAKFIDVENNLIETKQAYLSVVSYQGFPRIDIHTLDSAGIYSKDLYTPATIDVSNCASQYLLSNINAGVRLRGNGTLEASKKPYRLKFDVKQNLLGLNDDDKAKNWVLLAEFYDYSMLRNASAFMLGDSLLDNKGYYSSDFQHVNLYINNIFNGVYLLAEQQQVNKHRVEIYEPMLNETNLNIGYLLELDEYKDGASFEINGASYTATDSNGVINKIPTRNYSVKSDLYSNEQLQYIEKYLKNVYDVLYRAAIKGEYCTIDENHDVVVSDFTNSYDVINSVINIDSLMRLYLLEEIMCDIDVGFSSFYMYVDFSMNAKFNKLTFGAPWDFDWSSGNANGFCYETNHRYNSVFMDHMNPWLFLLSRTDFFESLMHEYFDLFTKSGVFDYMLRQIEDISRTYANDFERNYQKWQVLGTSQHTYHTSDVYNMHSQLDACVYLKKWLENRFNYLDSIF